MAGISERMPAFSNTLWSHNSLKAPLQATCNRDTQQTDPGTRHQGEIQRRVSSCTIQHFPDLKALSPFPRVAWVSRRQDSLGWGRLSLSRRISVPGTPPHLRNPSTVPASPGSAVTAQGPTPCSTVSRGQAGQSRRERSSHALLSPHFLSQEGWVPDHDIPKQPLLCSCLPAKTVSRPWSVPLSSSLQGSAGFQPSPGLPVCVTGDHRSQHRPGPAPHPHAVCRNGRFLHSPHKPHHQPHQVRPACNGLSYPMSPAQPSTGHLRPGWPCSFFFLSTRLLGWLSPHQGGTEKQPHS